MTARWWSCIQALEAVSGLRGATSKSTNATNQFLELRFARRRETLFDKRAAPSRTVLAVF
jgi:hypothetical protein